MSEPTMTETELVSRREAMTILRVRSKRTMHSYEVRGLLTPIPRGEGPRAPVNYIRSEVEALAGTNIEGEQHAETSA